MAEAWAFVAPVAVVIGLVCTAVARMHGQRSLPGWKHSHTSWTGLDVLLLVFAQLLMPPVIAKVLAQGGFFEAVYGPNYPPVPEGLRKVLPAHAASAGGAAAEFSIQGLAVLYTAGLWGRIFAAPVLIALGFGLLVVTERRSPRLEPAGWAGQIALGVAIWLVLVPVVMGVYFLAIAVMGWLGAEPDVHPLGRAGVGETLFDRVVFAASVCLFTPLAEEFVFRGLVVRWAAGAWYRPWGVMVGTGVAGVLPGGRFDPETGPMAFVAILGLGLYLLQRLGRRMWAGFPVRTASAVYSSAALFAIVHAAIWPTPVPLFVLGLGLGYVAARSRGIAGCVVLHGLFNAVSYVYLLRGGSG
jgi:membrane protease YdiL (CAAX protease family)